MKLLFKKIISYILQLESRLVIYRYKPKIVAITGSVGKTSTKDAVFAVLSRFAHVRKSEKSYNSEIGLPLAILGVPNGWNNPFVWLENILRGLWLFIYPHKYPKWLVLEVGVGHPGDMRKTASWLKTDAVIITAIGETPAHLEFFDSRKQLIEEKSGLIRTLKKDGLLVLNADDSDVKEMKTGKQRKRVIFYGFNPGADILGSGVDILYKSEGQPTGVIFRVDIEGASLPVTIPGVFGRNHMYASLASLALCFGLKFNLVEAAKALMAYDVPPGRMRLLKGVNETLIIDDTYNSSPFACEAALRTLSEVKSSGRKVAVLGDMLELGKYTEEAHRKVGQVAREMSDVLIVVGPRSEAIKAGAIEAEMKEKNIYSFLDSKAAAQLVPGLLEKGDLILVKGSQGMRMERVVEAILFNKDNKGKLLVRQDKEWLDK